MIEVKHYISAKTIDEAYEILLTNKSATILGGGAFIKMGNKKINTLIDLSKCDMNRIEETEDEVQIGAMVTFGEIENSPILKNCFNEMLSSAVNQILGVQFRNIVTIGATIYSRYGFSDLITGLLALDTDVELYKGGRIPLDKFLKEGPKEIDILKNIFIRKNNRRAAFYAMRNSKGDYAILNTAVSKMGKKVKIAVGARPGRAVLAENAMIYFENNDISKESLSEGIDILVNEINFGSNTRGSEAYRRKICGVLVKRALEEVSMNEA